MTPAGEPSPPPGARMPRVLVSPLLPVLVGGFLLAFLVVLWLAEPPPAPEWLDPSQKAARLIEANKQARALEKRGDYVSALAVFRDLPAEVREAHAADLRALERRLTDRAAEQLLERAERLRAVGRHQEAAQLLLGFLEENPLEPELRGRIEAAAAGG